LFILAANYLQSLDWRNQPEIMKHIITFYTKAKSFDSLSLFYDACAAVEIDEYKNYEKALGALKESGKYMTKAKLPGKETKILQIKKKIVIIEQFLTAKKLLPTQPDEAITICKELLDRTDIEEAIRAGDVYAQIVEHYYSQRKAQQAFEIIEKMRQRRVPLLYFLDKDVVISVYKAVGASIDLTTEEEVTDHIAEDI
jgi:intraflagellar transport protein 140